MTPQERTDEIMKFIADLGPIDDSNPMKGAVAFKILTAIKAAAEEAVKAQRN